MSQPLPHGGEVAKTTWLRQLKDTGVTRIEIEAAFDRLAGLHNRDSHLIQLCQGTNGENANNVQCSAVLSLVPAIPANEYNDNQPLHMSPEPCSSQQNNQYSSQRNGDYSSMDIGENGVNDGSQVNNDNFFPVLPADVSITAVANCATPTSSQKKSFTDLDDYEKQLKIREFMCMNGISEHVVSEMTRIKRSYLKSYFGGNLNAIKPESKKLVFAWYLSALRNPDRFRTFHSNIVNRNKTNNELIQTKRDRFIFRRQHIEILEKYLKETKYPDLFQKEDIALECNKATEQITGKPVEPKEKVTVTIVSNWFNNKRKEAKSKERRNRKRVNRGANSNNQSDCVTIDDDDNSNSNSQLAAGGANVSYSDVTEIIIAETKKMEPKINLDDIEIDESDVEELMI